MTSEPNEIISIDHIDVSGIVATSAIRDKSKHFQQHSEFANVKLSDCPTSLACDH